MRSATEATAARSCEHVDERDVELALQPPHLLEDRACVTTSRPVVGSSSTTSGRLADERERERDALLLAAGELVGEAPLERRVGGQLDALEHVAVSVVGVALGRVSAADLARSGRRPAIDGLSAVGGILRHVRDQRDRAARATRARGGRASRFAGDAHAARRRARRPGRA